MGAAHNASPLLLQVLSCPPASCLPFGCPGHEFVTKGVQGCGINTLSGAVGAQFVLQFVVFNSAQPALSANASRTIIVASPCATGEPHSCSYLRTKLLSQLAKVWLPWISCQT